MHQRKCPDEKHVSYYCADLLRSPQSKYTYSHVGDVETLPLAIAVLGLSGVARPVGPRPPALPMNHVVIKFSWKFVCRKWREGRVAAVGFTRPRLSARGGGVVRTRDMAVDRINTPPLGYRNIAHRHETACQGRQRCVGRNQPSGAFLAKVGVYVGRSGV